MKNKDLDFYKKYLYINLDIIIVSFFILGDLVVAFKNLSFNDSGIYFALSIFCKFVFIAFFFMKNIYDKEKFDNLNEDLIYHYDILNNPDEITY